MTKALFIGKDGKTKEIGMKKEILILIICIETFIIVLSLAGNLGIDNYSFCYDDCMSLNEEQLGVNNYQEKKLICNERCIIKCQEKY